MLLVRCPSGNAAGYFLTGNRDFPLALSQLCVLVNSKLCPQGVCGGVDFSS